MGRKEFFRDLNSRTRLRVLIITERGRVKKFTVQLEARIGEYWTPIARYDNAHGFAHLDLLYPHQAPQKIRIRAVDLNDAVALAFADLVANWETSINDYLQELASAIKSNGA